MKYVAKSGMTLANGKRLEEGEKADEAAFGKSLKWLLKGGHIEEATSDKPDAPKEGSK